MDVTGIRFTPRFSHSISCSLRIDHAAHVKQSTLPIGASASILSFSARSHFDVAITRHRQNLHGDTSIFSAHFAPRLAQPRATHDFGDKPRAELMLKPPRLPRTAIRHAPTLKKDDVDFARQFLPYARFFSAARTAAGPRSISFVSAAYATKCP